MGMGEMRGDMELPGFRFHPTEEELLGFYLKNMVVGKKLGFDVIGFLNIYHHDPWDLPGLAKVGEREWYFFVPRDKKHGGGGRPNRTTQKGFWKATGSDRKIISLSEPKRVMGLRKTLVFYQGRAPRGSKTDWVMNEYRLPDSSQCPKEQDIVLCKIYRKATSLKVLEQRAAMEEEMVKVEAGDISPCTSTETLPEEDIKQVLVLKKEAEEILVSPSHDEEHHKLSSTTTTTTTTLIQGKDKLGLGDLQLPIITNIDWNQDPLSPQLNSPWFSTFIPTLFNF